MKRPRSYGEDIDNGINDKALYKEWGRRDQDPDRLLSHRRFYPKAENGRKGLSSSNDWSLDDDREPLRPPRKRFEHDSDGFDRRKGFDRYRDCSDRAASISSPRSIYNGDRIHRSESFPAPPRREFPKGFRSDRDRLRREESVSAWRRSIANGKDADEDRVDLGRGSQVGSEDRGSVRSSSGSRDLGKSPTWSKDSGGEQSKSIELKKTEEAHRDSGNSSEMEEGELEPDPDPISEPDPDPISKPEPEPEPEVEPPIVVEPLKSLNGLETDTTKEAKSSHEEKLQIDDMGVCDGKREGGASEIVRDMGEKTDKGSDCQDNAVNELGGTNMGAEKEENVEEEECLHLPSPNPEFEARGKEELNEETSIQKFRPPKEEVKEQKGVENERKPSPLEQQKEEKGIDLETEAEDAALPNSNKAVEEDNVPDVSLTFVADNLNGNAKDKGKSLAVSPSNEGNSTENGGWMARDLLTGRDDPMEGPSSRGFELFFCSDVMRPEKTNQSGVDEFKAEKLKMEPLELALGLPNVSLALASHDPKQAPSSAGRAPNSPSRGRSVHSLPTTVRTSSDGFTASISFSGSHPFVHNPSCSLTQNSFENYEHSVGSHPIFQGVDQIPQGTCQGQSSNEPKRKEVPLYQRLLQNGNGTLHPSHASQGAVNRQAVQGQGLLKVSEGSTGMPNGLDRQLSLSRQFSGQLRRDEVRSPSHSVGSRETRSEHSMDKKQVMRERNAGGIFRTGQRELEQLVLSGIGVSEMIIAKIVSEPIQIMASRIQEMTEQSIAYLKESVCEMIGNGDKHGQLRALQEALQRSDFTLETLKTCHRTQLEILVALKTGLLDFLRSANNVPSSDLVEIFLNMKCRNLACRSSLPVDECDCKVCSQKNGFCSVCMCMVCSKFDMASNTCSWVGCDDCLHWCHTNCALRDLHIRNGRSVSGVQGTTEIRFHCVACGQPSEMFGFVKEVFKTCAKDWKADNLSKELEYVRRIFCSSDDGRGKRLHDVAARLLGMLENKSNLSEVYKLIMQFLTESDSKLGTTPALVKELSQKNPIEGSNGMVGPSQEAVWLRSVSTEKAPHIENANCVLPSMDWDRVGRHTSVPESQLNVDKKPVLDELESIVRIKQAEANMFQTRADDARREAEALKCIAIAKSKKIEEEYASRITKLHFSEAEERRRQKLEELQVIERAHREYFNMKMRMEADIKDLLLKMEATKRNHSM